MRTNTTSLNCFLIEDDLDDQEIFCMALCAFDDTIHCTFANDGVDAIEKLNGIANTPDFIFIDMNMPRMNGLQCLTQIKMIDRLKQIPVYMYSTSADPNAINEAMALGACNFIVKPANISELTNALSGILVKRHVFE